MRYRLTQFSRVNMRRVLSGEVVNKCLKNNLRAQATTIRSQRDPCTPKPPPQIPAIGCIHCITTTRRVS